MICIFGILLDIVSKENYKNTMIRLSLTLCLIVFGFWGFSQEMKMEECIHYALVNNISLTNVEIKASVAKERHQQSKRNMLPIVESGIFGNQLFGRSIDPKTNTYVSEGSIFSANMYLSAQISLFDGFKKQNRIRYDKLQYLMSREDVNRWKMDLAFKVMNAFYDVLYYTKLETIAMEQVKLTKLNLQHIQKQIDLGLKAESDLLEMQAHEAAEIHRQISLKNEKEMALLLLKKMMNFPVNQSFVVSETTLVNFKNTVPSVDSIYQMAHKHMPLLKKSELNLKANQKYLAIRRGDLYPSLSFGGNVSSSYSDSWTELIDPNNTEMGYKTIPFQNQFSNNISKQLFVQLRIPLFSRWENRSEIKIAKYNVETARNELLEAEQLLYQEIVSEHQQLAALTEEQKQLQIKQKAMQEAYKIAEKKLEQGLINVMDFYTAKNQLANAEAELLRVQLQRIVKEKTIDFYLGNEIY